MKTNKFLASIALIGLLSTGSLANSSENTLSQPNQKVQSLINKYNLESVTFDYVNKIIAKGTRSSAKAILIDARPEAKYKKGTIPSSMNIPDTKFDEYVSLLKDTPNYLWITGLPTKVQIITVGQEFVVSGQKVRPVAAEGVGLL